ncbi:hypothetical protein [Neorhizobium tomejilense]|uniref:hypothetical protein n=1 Tax=Neorhizobium tomejilense TaxID=2093828 RepID=UPI003ECCB83A
MPDTNPITITDILAAVDATARHAVPHVRGTVRGLTVREILRLARAHPGIAEIIDPSREMNAYELYLAVGRKGVVAIVSASTGRPTWRVGLMSINMLLLAFFGTLDVTMGERSIDDFFTEHRPEGNAPPAERPENGIRTTSRLMTMVRDAGAVTARLGIDGLALSPRRLAFTIRTLAGLDRTARQASALAVAAGMGSEKANEIIGELY